jgi:hypothetical protein
VSAGCHSLKKEPGEQICVFFLYTQGKVKCTLVQVLKFCTGRMAHKGSRGIALPFLDHGTRRG